MEQTFRASMSWLHTWAGISLGGLLFVIFWMGTLSVFDREIDRWMAPMTRLETPRTMVSLETMRPYYEAAAAAKAPTWFVTLPTDRDPTIRVSWRDGSGPVVRLANPATGALLPNTGTWAGTRFLFPFHYMLHIRVGQLSTWLVGTAAMAMLVLCVSGVVIHRKIFADFFTVRPQKQPRRLILDLHTMAGVLGLPFNFTIALSGLIIFWSIYFPAPLQIAYQGDRQAFNREAFDFFSRPKLGKPGTLGSIDVLMAEAGKLWDGEQPRYLFIRNPGDAAASVQMGRSGEDNVAGTEETVTFDAATGVLLHRRNGSLSVMTAQRFISGLHLIQFRHWVLRWTYFGLGLLGSALIATGYLFWLESRRKKHQQIRSRSFRLVEGLAAGNVTGIIIATLSFFVANRVLPLGANLFGVERYALEIWTFYLVWLATFVHAWTATVRIWERQCVAISALALAAVLLNWLTTGDHLARSLSHRHLWSVGAMDLLMLIGAGMAAWVAARLKSRRLLGVVEPTPRSISERGAS